LRKGCPMDPTTFDRLSQTLGAAGSRRAALRVLAGTALAAVTPTSRRAAAQGGCPPDTKLCGGVCCPLTSTCCTDNLCCLPGLKCCANGVTCVNPDTHICCDAPCLSGGCPSGSTCCCRPDGLSGGCCNEGEVCQEQPVGPPVCVLPPCPDGRSRCGGVCCGDGQDCQFAQCVDACPPDLTTARQRREGVTAEATCPQCGTDEFPCLANGAFVTCCDGTCCFGPGNATVACCHPDQTCCGGVCCGGASDPTKVCVEPGRCGCAADREECGGKCLPRCPGGGGWVFDPSQMRCRCVCPPDKPQICGGVCRAKCPAGTTRDRGTCRCTRLRCGDRLTKCSGRCVDLRSDEKNCGGCGTRCGAGQVCRKSACVKQ